MTTAPTTTGPTDAVSAWVSGTGIAHLSLTCPGLDRMREFGHDPAEALEEVPAADLTGLVNLRNGEGRVTSPCRLCALEPVVDAVLSTLDPDRDTAADKFVMFRLSRPVTPGRRSKKRSGTDERSLQIAQEKAERLRRIAARAAMSTTVTVKGGVAYGFLPTALIDDLSAIVETQVRFTVTTVPDEMVVSTFFSLISDPSSTLTNDASADPQAPTDAWYVAEMICGVPA